MRVSTLLCAVLVALCGSQVVLSPSSVQSWQDIGTYKLHYVLPLEIIKYCSLSGNCISELVCHTKQTKQITTNQ
jgi:hypothetical protein